MKKTLAALAVTPLALMALAGPAAAAKPTVTRTTERVAYAVASSDAELSKFVVIPSLTRTGPLLTLWQATADGAGGSVETTVDTNRGFTFTIDKGRLGSATLVATNLPASTCTWQEDQKIGCVDTTVDINLRWTGFGGITRGGSTSHEMGDGFKLVSHGRGTSRGATVAGSITIGTTTLDAPDYAELGTYQNFEMLHCTGAACPQPEPQRSR